MATHSNNYPKLHNAAWPGLVGKGPDSEPPIDLDTMINMTAAASVDGIKFDGMDLFLFDPHISIDISDDHSDLKVFVNPEILEREGEDTREEGCLSVPGVYDVVKRAKRIRVRARDRDGNTFELNAEGLLAVCIQHEMDHLEGKVFVEYLSQLKQNRIKTKLRKRSKQDQAA